MGRRWKGLLALAFFTLVTTPAMAEDLVDEVQFTWYGYFKLDVAYDNALSSHGNFIMYVKPQPDGKSTNTINITSRQTRIGLKVNRGDTRGNLEFDFYGGGAENKNLLMLRQAYLDIPLGPLSLIAGQTSDIMSPLVPSTLNYSVGWGAGNIGYRRPQLRIYTQQEGTYAGVAIARNISGDLNGDTVVDGEDSCMPILEARLAQTLTSRQFKLTLGGSGHYGFMNIEDTPEDHYNTWSLNADLRIDFNPNVSLLGELYTGANTGAYLGAILNGDCAQDLKSLGGWANLQFKAFDGVRFSLGGGLDDLRDESNTTLGGVADARSRNTFLFGNIVYSTRQGTSLGFELSSWTTTYNNPTPGNQRNPTDLRLQWSVQQNF